MTPLFSPSGRLHDGLDINTLEAKAGEIRKEFMQTQDNAGISAADKAGLYGLADLRLVIRRNRDRIGLAVDELAARAKALDADLDQLAMSERKRRTLRRP